MTMKSMSFAVEAEPFLRLGNDGPGQYMAFPLFPHDFRAGVAEKRRLPQAAHHGRHVQAGKRVLHQTDGLTFRLVRFQPPVQRLYRGATPAGQAADMRVVQHGTIHRQGVAVARRMGSGFGSGQPWNIQVPSAACNVANSSTKADMAPRPPLFGITGFFVSDISIPA